MVVTTAHPPAGCSRCGAALDSHDLCCPVCGCITPVAPQETIAAVARCTGCGASATFDPQKNLLACAFCGSAYEVEQPRDPIDPIDWFVPFTVSPAEASSAVNHWLHHQDILRPKNLVDASMLESIRPIWWGAWVVDTDCDIFYAADVDVGPQPKIWRPMSGSCGVSFRGFVVPATRGLKKAETDWLLQQVSLTDLKPVPVGPPTATSEAIELQRSGVWPEILSAIGNQATAHVGSAGILPGNRHKNLRVSPLLSGLTTKRVGFPVYILAYRYDGECFRVLVDGRDKSRVFGDAPLSTIKLALVVLMILLILAALVVAMW